MSFRFSFAFRHQADPAVRDAARDAVHQDLDNQKLPFAQRPYQDETSLLAIEHVARRFRERFKTFVIIGIGGSDLGTRAVQRALNHQFYNMVSDRRMFFVGDTTDPLALEEVMSQLNWQETGIVVVSKSGNTIEVMSAFLILRDRLKAVVGDHAYVDHIVCVTDPVTGTLREVVHAEGYASLPHLTVGGRFSVLSSVGLFPLALANVDIRGLLNGAKDFLETEKEHSLEYAAAQHAAYLKGQHIHVLMPYTYALRELGFWFRQLWAESLGKALDLNGKTVNVGPTPIAAIGPTDQHSQVQLYREGPDDKTFTFITVVETFDLEVPTELPQVQAIQYLKGLSLNHILHAEQEGTEASLQEVGRPTARIELDRLDAYHMGGLIMFFELATAYAGAMFNINTYDQPGVERGKEIAHSRLADKA
jgi:glucose-6-phosphate isomerase